MFNKSVVKIREKIKSRKISSIIYVLVVIVSIIILSVAYAPKSNAGIFNNIYNNFIHSIDGKNTQLPNSYLNNLKNKNINPVENKNTVSAQDYEEAVIGSVKKTTPAVVSIVISKDIPIITQCPYNPLSNLPEEFQQFFGGSQQFYQQCEKGTEKKEVGGGSGFIVNSNGLIITNKHVVSDTKAEYSVMTNDGKTYDAKVLARHPSMDLAVLKINASNLATVSLGDSSSLQLGQTVMSIGNALGQFRNTVSKGVVSGLGRDISASSPESGSVESIENVIQTDAAINPGNSGGPLINIYGDVIGINVAMVSGAQSIGFAIPINEAKRAIESVEKTGEINMAYLGVRFITLNKELSKQFKTDISEGALLKGDEKNFAVEPNSPASKAGLVEGDIIVEIDGKKINKDNKLSSVINNKNPGDEIDIKVWRSGKYIHLHATLTKRK